MKINWIPFDPDGSLPPERKVVLVQLSQVRGFGVGAVAVGYLRIHSGGPFFVTPGVKRTNYYFEPEIPCEEMDVTHWADIFGDEFEAPGWPGTHEGAVTRAELQGRRALQERGE